MTKVIIQILKALDIYDETGPLTGRCPGLSKKERGRTVALTWAERKQYGGVS